MSSKGEEGSTASSPSAAAEGEQEHTTKGTGNTRKLAKNAAADAMLVQLGIHPKQLEDLPDKTDDPLRRQLRDALEKLHQRQMRSSGLVPQFLGIVRQFGYLNTKYCNVYGYVH